MKHVDASRVLTMPEVAARLRLCPRVVFGLLKSGRLRRLAGIRKVLVPVEEVNRFIRDGMSFTTEDN